MTTTDTAKTEVAPRLDHATLDHEIVEWREWWGQLAEIGKPKMDEMANRLAQFREHLTEHFTVEENVGCLSPAEGVSSETASRIAMLRNEHQELLVHLDQLIAKLQGCHPKIDCWGQAREEFEELLDRLNSHEEAEEELSRSIR